jgi:hypothetical protein
VKRALLSLALLTACSSSKPTPVQPVASTPVAADAGATPTETKDAGSSAGDPAMSSKETRVVAKTLDLMSELRGVKATKAVPGVKLKREELVARVKEKALREYPPEALRREGQLIQIMGFAPASFDYLGEMMKLLEAQLEGFYDPKNGTMYLASELKGKEAQATLAHELVHALQDQRWDLKSRSDYKPGQGDKTLALAALAEGDATSAMFDFVMYDSKLQKNQQKTALDIPEEMLREMMRTAINTGEIRSVPHILRSTLVAPYVDGLVFVQALRRKGGWVSVDKAWDRLPTTTEQILHVEKWESNEAALAIPAPSAGALGEGWKKEDEDSFGELGFALTFEEWVEHVDARAAAAGWGGDRSAVYQKGDEIAFAVHSRYDALPFAERAMAKLTPGLKKVWGKAAIADGWSLCFERKDLGPLLVARKDKDFVLLAGPAKVAGTAWSSASTCTTAKKWAEEILAQK